MAGLLELNAKRIEMEIAAGQDRVRCFPNDIFFSTEHRCNLRCVMCTATAERKRGLVPLADRRLPEMTMARFRKLEPQLACWQEVRLTGSGETLLSKDLPRILEILAPHPAITSFATNGLLLDEEKAAFIIRHRLNRVVISMDAARKETYERIRTGGKWEVLLERVNNLVRMKRESGSELPEIYFYGNFRRDNIEELPELVDFAAAHDGAGVWAHKTIIYDSDLKNLDLSRFPELTRRMVAEAAIRARGYGIAFGNWVLDRRTWEQTLESVGIDTGRSPESPMTSGRAADRRLFGYLGRRLRGIRGSAAGRVSAMDGVSGGNGPSSILDACRRPWTGLLVQSDGKVRVCCNSSILLGNLNEQSFDEIWNGAPARALRRSFLDGHPPEGCRTCVEVTNLLNLSSCYIGKSLEDLPGYLDRPEEGDMLRGVAPIQGWLLDQQGIRSAQLFIDGEPAGEMDCGLERPDVASLMGSEGHALHSGFAHRFDTRVFNDGYHLLSLTFQSRDSRRRELFHRTVQVNNGQ